MALTLFALTSKSAHAAGPWYVTTGGNDSNDCLGSLTPCATINGAIGKASSGDTIKVATGTYTSSTGSEVVLLNKSAILSGGWDVIFTTQSGASTIDGQVARRGVIVNSGVTTVFERFVIQHANSGNGAGIFNSGNLTLNNTTVFSNTAIGFFGGGIYNSGSLTLINSTISQNISTVYGGGIDNDSGTLVLHNSTVKDNTGWYGGGIMNYGGTMHVVNSTISMNSSSQYGGGIYNGNSGQATLNSSTVSNNTSNNGGGVIADSGQVTVRNTIVSGNTAPSNPDCSGGFYGSIASAGYNLIGNVSGCLFTLSSGDLTNVDPKLGALQDNGGPTPTQALLAGSPAIDAGNPAGCLDNLGNTLSTDQRGLTRFGRCDIGAYEAQAIKSVHNPLALPGSSVTYTIAFHNGRTNPLASSITDTLPAAITYTSNSLTATSGSFGYGSGVITWTGTISASQIVAITFAAEVSSGLPWNTTITNTATINDGGIILTPTATVLITYTDQVFLPVIKR